MFNIANARFAFLDIETTGLSPWFGDRISQIAIVLTEGKRIKSTLDLLVNPERILSPSAVHINGLDESKLSAAPKFAEVAEAMLKVYDHPLWKKYEKKAENAGHGGMDWFVINSFVECLKANKPATIDAYDAATWLSITTLSEESIALGSHPVAFPDFTRGRWIKRKNEFALGDMY